MIWDRERALDECQDEVDDPHPFDWRCEGCGALYLARPARCALCGADEFKPVEDLPL